MRRNPPARRGRTTIAASCLGLTLCAAVSLTACTADSDPRPPPPGTPDSNPSPTPSPLHPGTAGTTTTTTAPSGNPTDVAATAAIAAVHAWEAGFNESLRSTSTKAFRRTFSTRCAICLRDAEVTDGFHAKGELIEGGEYSA